MVQPTSGRRRGYGPPDSGNIITGELREGVSSNSFASGSNQNCGNVITNKRITRIHAPPGGESTFSISTMMSEPAASPSKKPYHESERSRPAGSPTNSPKNISSNAFASGTNQNAGNVITDRPTTRVSAPPGGRSSFSLI